MYSAGTKFTITFISLPILSNSPFSSILPRERTRYSRCEIRNQCTGLIFWWKKHIVLLFKTLFGHKRNRQKGWRFVPRGFGLMKWKSAGKFLTFVLLPPKKERPNLVSAARIGKLARYVGAVFALRPSIRRFSMKRFRKDSEQGQHIWWKTM